MIRIPLNKPLMTGRVSGALTHADATAATLVLLPPWPGLEERQREAMQATLAAVP